MQHGLELGGRYLLEERLGRGGMGEVWRAVDQRLRRQVAVKILPLSGAADGNGVARFRREAEIAATLNHPGITTVFDIDEHRLADENLLFLVMELMLGRDLQRVLAEHPRGLSIEQAVGLAVQVLDALRLAHEKGVVHRDIKPANLFLLETGQVKVCDFGIARLADATKITATGGVSGTPLYMAPEQVKGRSVDQRTDLYAFGCVLYELLTGRPWIDVNGGVAAILYQHLDDTPAPPDSLRPDIPSHISALVLKLLAKDPDDRPSAATEVAETLIDPDSTRVVTVPPLAPQPTRVVTDRPGPVATLTGHTGAVLAIAHGSGLLVSGGGPGDGTVRVWDLTDRSQLGVLPGGERTALRAVAVDPRAAVAAAAGGYRDGSVRMWDLSDGKELHPRLRGHAGDIHALAFSAEGTLLASGGADATIRIWDHRHHVQLAELVGHAASVYALAFSPTGNILASAGLDGVLRLWTIAPQNDQRRGSWRGPQRPVVLGSHRGGVHALAFTPDGAVLASACWDGSIALWDVETHRQVATLPKQDSPVTALAFSPDGRRLASGGRDDLIRLWDTATGRELVTATGHADQVHGLVFTPSGSLISASADSTIGIWQL